MEVCPGLQAHTSSTKNLSTSAVAKEAPAYVSGRYAKHSRTLARRTYGGPCAVCWTISESLCRLSKLLVMASISVQIAEKVHASHEAAIPNMMHGCLAALSIPTMTVVLSCLLTHTRRTQLHARCVQVLLFTPAFLFFPSQCACCLQSCFLLVSLQLLAHSSTSGDVAVTEACMAALAGAGDCNAARFDAFHVTSSHEDQASCTRLLWHCRQSGLDQQ